jgi:hypothetical protein
MLYSYVSVLLLICSLQLKCRDFINTVLKSSRLTLTFMLVKVFLKRTTASKEVKEMAK